MLATRRPPTEAALLFCFELANPAVEVPKLYIMTIHKLFGLFLCGLVVLAQKVDPLLNVTIRAYEIGAISDHFGAPDPASLATRLCERRSRLAELCAPPAPARYLAEAIWALRAGEKLLRQGVLQGLWFA